MALSVELRSSMKEYSISHIRSDNKKEPLLSLFLLPVKLLIVLFAVLFVQNSYGQTFCIYPNTTITDNSTISRQIVVSGTIGTITDLDVYINITHPWISDLHIWLKSPNGTIVYLIEDKCIGADDIITYFDDEGSPLVCPPASSGSTIPQGSLSAFDGQSMNGTWTIYIEDDFTGDVGTFHTCCLFATLDLDETCPLSVNPELPIPDNQTIYSQIEVSNTYGIITDVNVRVGLTHPWIGDLKIWVKSPAGTIVDLFNRDCNNSRYQNIVTYFDDEGLVLACPPVNGVVTIPAAALSAFDGQQVNGTWTIYIQDNATTDVGTFHGWCLDPTIESDCSDYSKTPLTAIEDLQTVSDQITVSGTSGIILDLDVRVGITHTWIGDLSIWMESPAGTVIDLYDRDCGYDSLRFRNIETYFNDEGAALTCPPTSGVLSIPVSPLSALDGESLNGTWTIYVRDNILYDNGVLNGWCLIPTLGDCINNSQCDDGNACTTDLCQNNHCRNECTLEINNPVFTSNSIVGCDDGTVTANISFASCSSTWTASLLIGNTVYKSWPSSQGSSLTWDNIAPGNYIMTATGAGCADTTNINIGVGVPCSIQFENPDSSHAAPTSVQGCADGSVNASVDAFVCGGALAWSAILYDTLNNVINSFTPTIGSAMLWENLHSGKYRIVASANSSSCNAEFNVVVPSGPPCNVQIQNLHTSVADCSNDSITADIATLTCNDLWYAYLYVINDYSNSVRSWDYTQGSSILWTNIPLGTYHLIATDLANCSDTMDVILSCSDNDPCTIDNCTGGCSHTDKCDDNNPCTVDFCQTGGICQNQAVICNDGDPCTTDACVNGTCVTTPINCADANACTVDQCFNGNCTHTAVVCTDGNACTNDICQSGVCTFIPICIIDDNNACTDDYCVNRTCQHVQKNCNDSYSCTSDYCLGGQCFNDSLCVLDDGEACTKDQCLNGICAHIDTCSAGSCINDPGICDDGNLCTIDSCITGNCVSVPKICDDGISCTDDSCGSNGNCVYIPSCDLNDGDPCTIDTCGNGDCLHFPMNCNDNNDCTNDSCENGTCIFQPLCIIDDLDPCTNDFCLIAQCVHQDIVCNDGLLCTNDGCLNGACVYEPIACDDGNPCTIDSCLSGNCIFSLDTNCSDPCDLIVCDDLNPCTTDSCSNGSCLFSAIDCDDSDICTADSCNNGACAHAPLANCNLTISGAILSEMGAPITGVTVDLTGSSVQSLTTSNDGLFSFNITQGDDCTITPSKSNDSITNNGITTLDIILLQRQILAILPLNSPFKKIAADVNNSQTITTLDIVFIRSVILQTSTTFPNDRLWTFVNSDFTFNDSLPPFPFENFRSYSSVSSGYSNQDFIAIKLGDVNNSWNPNMAKVEAVDEMHFILSDYNVLTGDEIIVPLRVRDFKNITGFQFTLSWDPNVLELLEVNNRSLNSFFGMNAVANGFLTTSWYDDLTKMISLSDEETVFDLKFIATGTAGSFSKISIGSELTASEAYNEHLDLVNIIPTNGMVKIGDTSAAIGQRSLPCELNVQPNPFSNITNILFLIPENRTVSIVIYDLLGKEIKHIHGRYTAGQHSVEWAGDDDQGRELSKGLYHLRMVAGNHSLGLKVVLVK